MTTAHTGTDRAERSGLTLLFARGARPRIEDIARLSESAADAASRFAITHDGGESGLIELLDAGLTFELTGLEPGAAAANPRIRHIYQKEGGGDPAGFEAIALRPGEHLRAGASLLPVVRTMAGIGARLAALPQVQSVVWHPAAAQVDPSLFAAAVERWLGGGPFPAPPLIGLTPRADGHLESEGLDFLVGQELRIDGDVLEPARLAARLANVLVDNGAVLAERCFEGMSGEPLVARPEDGGQILAITRAG